MLKTPVKMAALAMWIGVFYLLVWGARRAGKLEWRDRRVCQCYRGILRIIGIRLTVSGELAAARPLLLVSNHVSYLDIAVLGSRHAVRYTPKSEIAAWPAIGAICRACDAVFIDRRPEKVKEMKEQMQAALAGGQVVSLFPEGTTGDGLHMQPFRSGFFSLAEEPVAGQALAVQPAAIVYTRIRRLPIDRTQWPQLAWYGDMELLSHVRGLLALGPIEAELIFLPPLEGQKDRKELAAQCHKQIVEAVEAVRSRPRKAQLKRKSLLAQLSRSKS